MKRVHLAIILGIILHALILIAIPEGHGYGLMAMFDFYFPVGVYNALFSQGDFSGDWLIMGMTILSVIGKVLLFISLFRRFENRKNLLRVIGVIALVGAYAIVCFHNGNELGFQLLSGIFGGPFLVCAVYILKAVYAERGSKELVTE